MGYIVDPYGDNDDLLPEEQCIGRRYFARSPEPGSIPVSFYDLPPRTRDTLQDMIDKDYPFGTAPGMDWP